MNAHVRTGQRTTQQQQQMSTRAHVYKNKSKPTVGNQSLTYSLTAVVEHTSTANASIERGAAVPVRKARVRRLIQKEVHDVDVAVAT